MNIKNCLRAKEIAHLLSIGLSTWWLWVKIGKAPAGKKLSNRVTVWEADSIQAFIDGSYEKEQTS